MKRPRTNPQIVLKNGKPSAVLIGIAEYEAMLESLEQIDDLKAIRQMKAADRKTVSFQSYLQKRRRNVSA